MSGSFNLCRLITWLTATLLLFGLVVAVHLHRHGFALVNTRDCAPVLGRDLGGYLAAPGYVIFRQIADALADAPAEISHRGDFERLAGGQPMSFRYLPNREVHVDQYLDLQFPPDATVGLDDLKQRLAALESKCRAFQFRLVDLSPTAEPHRYRLHYAWKFPVAPSWRLRLFDPKEPFPFVSP